MFIGACIMWVIAKIIQIEWKKDLERLKDFEIWEEWKNRHQ
jgi:hypothetical protein